MDPQKIVALLKMVTKIADGAAQALQEFLAETEPVETEEISEAALIRQQIARAEAQERHPAGKGRA